MTLVGRLAPSPTGHLHLGHAFAFLIAWWSARHQNGLIRLRFDDLDRDRAHQNFVDQARIDLEWLGIDWDGPVIFESSRAPIYAEATAGLVERRFAYPCVCRRGDILARQTVAAPHAGGELRYPGTCRPSPNANWPVTKTQTAAWRFIVSSGVVPFEDLNFGPQEIDVAAEVGDFVLERRDGTPAYQLAVVLDDQLDGVTEIVRGADLLQSTARQQLLAKALGVTPPMTFHVPLICDAAGRRLAKREHSLSLLELRESGVDPRAIVTWIATLAGQLAPNERPEARRDATSWIRNFDRQKVGIQDHRLPPDPKSTLLAVR